MNLQAGIYSYRLKQIDRDGKLSYSNEAEVTIGIVPKVFALDQNFPNPFNPTTTISYAIAEPSIVKLVLFDDLGREVQTLVNESKEAGFYKVNFNAAHLSSGLYIYKISAGQFSAVKKMLLLK